MDCFHCQHADCINDDFRRIHKNEINWARQKRYKNAGLCCVCGKRPLYNAWYCLDCLQNVHDRINGLRARRIASGLCPRCGRVPEDPRFKRCRICRSKDAEMHRNSYRDKKMER